MSDDSIFVNQSQETTDLTRYFPDLARCYESSLIRKHRANDFPLLCLGKSRSLDAFSSLMELAALVNR